MIWYQGESNELQADAYRSLFPAAIQGWRKAWNQGDFPFLFVQLPGFVGHNDWLRERSQHWPELARRPGICTQPAPNRDGCGHRPRQLQ
jgi:sialate O-acetylesterase